MIEGKDPALSKLLLESGGHRWQRIPPTERRGRVHTSTVTVAVFEIKPESSWSLNESDIEEFTKRDTGPGGQHRNKRDTCVVMRHRPTGIEVKAAARCQHQNRRTAREMLETRVSALLSSQQKNSQDAERRGKIGSGMRGDKVRTYREQDDVVTDHRSESKARLTQIKQGKLELVW